MKWIGISLLVLLMACGPQEPLVEPDQGQKEDMERIYRPLLHHFSSTGCGPCGRFGIPVFEQVANEMGDSILPLITHFKYRDPFITESSQAIEQAILDEWYSPQIWLNEKDITFDIIYEEIPDAVAITKERLRSLASTQTEAYVDMEVNRRDDGRFDARLIVENATASNTRFHVEIYSMEDSLVASQAGADPFVATHYRVNRGGHFSGMGRVVELGPDQQQILEKELIPCWVCTSERLYFYAIVWKEVAEGRFEYVNGVRVDP